MPRRDCFVINIVPHRAGYRNISEKSEGEYFEKSFFADIKEEPKVMRSDTDFSAANAANALGSNVRISDLQEFVKDNCRAAKKPPAFRADGLFLCGAASGGLPQEGIFMRAQLPYRTLGFWEAGIGFPITIQEYD